MSKSLRISRFFLPIFFAVFAVGNRAKADTISTFTFGASLASGSATGTLTIDTTTGTVNSGSISANNGLSRFGFGTVSSQVPGSGLYSIVLTSASNASNAFDLNLPVSSLVGYGGGAIDSLGTGSASELSMMGLADTATSGSLTLASVLTTSAVTASPAGVAATPEVASWILMLTGMAGIVVLARRRRPLTQAAA